MNCVPCGAVMVTRLWPWFRVCGRDAGRGQAGAGAGSPGGLAAGRALAGSRGGPRRRGRLRAAAALRRHGHAEERGGGLAGLGAGCDAEFGEPGFQQAQGAADRVGPARCGLQPHDPLVEVFVEGVVAERGFQRGQRLVGVGGLEEFGDAGPGVQRAAAGGLGVGLGPVVSGAVGQRPPVQRGCVLAGRQAGRVVPGGLAGRFQGGLEVRDVGGDERRVEAVAFRRPA